MFGPGPISNQVQVAQSRSGIPQRVPLEARHGAFDAIEPPTGQAVAVGGQGEKQVQADVRRFQTFEEPVAAEAMVDPGERGRDLANSLRHEHGQRFSESHVSHSGTKKSRRRGPIRDLFAISSTDSVEFYVGEKNLHCAQVNDCRSP